jgi:hypothetical protein
MKFLLVFYLTLFAAIGYGQIYTTISGEVEFVSDAPLELIEASSDQMQGVLDIGKKSFAFKMYIKSFDGFNNPLQQVHFYENYMEANVYPIATFTGKILENIEEGKKEYRAKGALDIHGKSVERVIDVVLTISDNAVGYSASFIVPLAEHDIKLPRIVYQKIAEDILVTIKGELICKK